MLYILECYGTPYSNVIRTRGAATARVRTLHVPTNFWEYNMGTAQYLLCSKVLIHYNSNKP